MAMNKYGLVKILAAISVAVFSYSSAQAGAGSALHLKAQQDVSKSAIIKVDQDSWLDDDNDGYVEEYSSHRKVKKYHRPHHYDDEPYHYKKHRSYDHGRKYHHRKGYHRHHHGYDRDYYRPRYISVNNAKRILNRHGYYKVHFVNRRLPVYKARACKHGRHYHLWVSKWGKITKTLNVGYCNRYSRIRDFWKGRRHHY